MLCDVRSPTVFPDFVRQHSVAFDYVGDFELDGIEIPVSLKAAVPKRRLEFVAGRHCAREALRALAPSLACTPIAIAPDRHPEWPAGIVGSITHTDGFSSAVVARTTDAIGIGVDAEMLLAPETAREIAHVISTSEELARLSTTNSVSDQLLLTATFCAKESIFKCLHRRVGRYFDFLDVEITSIDLRAGRFAGQLVRPLTEHFARGMPLSGRLALQDERIYAGVTLLTPTPIFA